MTTQMSLKINMEDVLKILDNYDNMETLQIIRYLLTAIINDIELMKSNDNFLGTAYNLGNGNCIRIEDTESLCSFIDTINDIIRYNNKKTETKLYDIFMDLRGKLTNDELKKIGYDLLKCAEEDENK